MSKAVLVIDMPESCDYCRMASLVSNDDVMCAIDRMTKRKYEDACKDRPDWCPLVPLPEKVTEPIDSEDVGKDYSEGTMDGWNACLDAIGGE